MLTTMNSSSFSEASGTANFSPYSFHLLQGSIYHHHYHEEAAEKNKPENPVSRLQIFTIKLTVIFKTRKKSSTVQELSLIWKNKNWRASMKEYLNDSCVFSFFPQRNAVSVLASK